MLKLTNEEKVEKTRNYRPRTLSEISIFAWVKSGFVAKLLTNHHGFLQTPIFIADCSPLVIVMHLNTPSSNVIICRDQANSICCITK